MNPTRLLLLLTLVLYEARCVPTLKKFKALKSFFMSKFSPTIPERPIKHDDHLYGTIVCHEDHSHDGGVGSFDWYHDFPSKYGNPVLVELEREYGPGRAENDEKVENEPERVRLIVNDGDDGGKETAVSTKDKIREKVVKIKSVLKQKHRLRHEHAAPDKESGAPSFPFEIGEKTLSPWTSTTTKPFAEEHVYEVTSSAKPFAEEHVYAVTSTSTGKPDDEYPVVEIPAKHRRPLLTPPVKVYYTPLPTYPIWTSRTGSSYGVPAASNVLRQQLVPYASMQYVPNRIFAYDALAAKPLDPGKMPYIEPNEHDGNRDEIARNGPETAAGPEQTERRTYYDAKPLSYPNHPLSTGAPLQQQDGGTVAPYEPGYRSTTEGAVTYSTTSTMRPIAVYPTAGSADAAVDLPKSEDGHDDGWNEEYPAVSSTPVSIEDGYRSGGTAAGYQSRGDISAEDDYPGRRGNYEQPEAGESAWKERRHVGSDGEPVAKDNAIKSTPVPASKNPTERASVQTTEAASRTSAAEEKSEDVDVRSDVAEKSENPKLTVL